MYRKILLKNVMTRRNDKMYAFGIDVGGTTVKLGLLSSEGELLDKW